MHIRSSTLPLTRAELNLLPNFPTVQQAHEWYAVDGPAFFNTMDRKSLFPLDPRERTSKAQAVDDAKAMQIATAEECRKSGQAVPPYDLKELIGKGSFGRVYKA